MKLKASDLINLLDMGKGIHVFAITGGPCSGKTTGMARLSKWLSDRGYKVIVVPEAATLTFSAGVFCGEGHLPNIKFQEMILDYVLAQEQLFLAAAVNYRDQGMKVVVLCDRGTLDGEAYLEKLHFEDMLERKGFTFTELCDHRYHAVCHLRTVACGKPECYTVKNNAVRTEDLEKARTVDQRTLDAWLRHRHLRVIDNSTGFDEKLERLFAEVLAVLGDPVPVERERKFLVKQVALSKIPVKTRMTLITQDYLVSADPLQIARVRKRESDDGVCYYHTVKRAKGPGERIEEERLISEREYEMLLVGRDSRSRTVVKRRFCFVWNDGHYELDFFLQPDIGGIEGEQCFILEAERLSMDVPVEIPDFLELIREVTDDPRYSNSEIAKGAWELNP